MLLECQWQNQVTPCQHLFVLRPTDDGLCCGFNHLELDWNDSRQQNPYEYEKFNARVQMILISMPLGLRSRRQEESQSLD